jgi:diacylglycerol kinase (ATP)
MEKLYFKCLSTDALKFKFGRQLEGFDMVCCALLSSLIAFALWFKRNVLRRPVKCRSSPLQWRLNALHAVAAKSEERHNGWSARYRSFGYAMTGLKHILKHERNAQIHAGVTVLVVLAAAALGLERWEWAIILLAISLVLILEAVNTAIERLCDFVQPEWDPRIGLIKDMTAGAVLLGAGSSVVIGLLVFAPHLNIQFPATLPVWKICRGLL